MVMLKVAKNVSEVEAAPNVDSQNNTDDDEDQPVAAEISQPAIFSQWVITSYVLNFYMSIIIVVISCQQDCKVAFGLDFWSCQYWRLV